MPRRRPTMHLPPELLHLIVGYVPTDDTQSLWDLSLACRCFAAIARPIIFHTVSLDTRWPGSQTVGDKFLRLLERSPDLAPLVKDLRIIEGVTGRGRKSQARRLGNLKKTTYRWVHDGCRALSVVLPLLTKLSSLSLQVAASGSIPWKWLSGQFKSALRDAAPKLHSLRCIGLAFTSVTELKDFISLVPSTNADVLANLTFKTIEAFPNWSQQPLQLTAWARGTWQPKLRSLTFSDDLMAGEMFQFLFATVDLSCLSCLSFRVRNSDQITTLLNTFPANNVMDRLGIWFTNESGVTQQPLDLASSFPSLNALYVSSPFSFATLVALVDNCLSIPSLSPSAVIFEVTEYRRIQAEDEQAELEQWSRFIDVLRRWKNSDPSIGIECRLNKWNSSKSVRRRASKYGSMVESLLRRLNVGEDLIRWRVVSENIPFSEERADNV
ncbi:hypothetical protein C8F01DRAFT_1127715 [Mycena amicta]|nr:hypothetical protein C8F01DRAFT_1127715 [Mycena amicta]